MGYPTRPSNVRVYQFRQPPGCSRLILPNAHRTGTRCKTRTRNLLIRSQALYPLSYAGAAHSCYGSRTLPIGRVYPGRHPIVLFQAPPNRGEELPW